MQNHQNDNNIIDSSNNVTIEIIPKLEENKENQEVLRTCINQEEQINAKKQQTNETQDVLNLVPALALANYYAYLDSWYQKQNYMFQLALIQKRSVQFQLFNLAHQV